MVIPRRLSILFVVIVFISCLNEKRRIGNSVIKAIDDYQNLYKRVPYTLEDIGVVEKEEDSIHYLRKNDSTYIIWYGVGVGESMVYSSVTKEWEKDNQ